MKAFPIIKGLDMFKAFTFGVTLMVYRLIILILSDSLFSVSHRGGDAHDKAYESTTRTEETTKYDRANESLSRKIRRYAGGGANE